MPKVQAGATVRLNNEQNKGERRKPVIVASVIVVILVGVFVLILFFFHSGPSTKRDFKPGTILASECPQVRSAFSVKRSYLIGASPFRKNA